MARRMTADSNGQYGKVVHQRQEGFVNRPTPVACITIVGPVSQQIELRKLTPITFASLALIRCQPAADTAIAHAESLQLRVSVAVVDHAGHLLGSQAHAWRRAAHHQYRPGQSL